jgi:hypothetical protein
LTVLTCGIMFLRRIPALLILYPWIPEVASWRQALFSGHFGMSFLNADPLLIDSASCRSRTFVKECMIRQFLMKLTDGCRRCFHIDSSTP